MSAMLEMHKLTKKFGGIVANFEIDLTIDEGELVGLIGPNGAGKTTLFNVISGVYRPTSGRIIYKGEDITGLSPDKIAAKGLVRTFQLAALFSNRTVFENVFVATHLQSNLSYWSAIFNTTSYRERERRAHVKALEVLNFVALDNVKDELASNLPHGYQRSLGLAIALATNPHFLLLDEPMSGMNRKETESMMDLVKRISRSGVTILLVEHNMRAVMGICERVLVLNFGVRIAEGSPDEVVRNNTVVQAYLGTKYVA